MKYCVLPICFLVLTFAVPACRKNNNPVSPKSDSTSTATFPADSASSIVVVTGTRIGYYQVESLLVFNPDGTLRWKKDQLPEAIGNVKIGYAGGTIFLSTDHVLADTISAQVIYTGYGKLYAFNETDGSVKWSYVDSNFFYAAPTASGGEMYLSQPGFIQGFDANTGAPNQSVGVASNWLWTPLIDGDTLYIATAPQYGPYSVAAVVPTAGKTLWTTPAGINAPQGIMVAGSKLIYATGTGALVALDKSTGVMAWSVTDARYDGMQVVSGNTLFAFDYPPGFGPGIGYPQSLRAFDLLTGGQLWQDSLPKITNQIGGIWRYGKTVCYYGYKYPDSYLQMVDPKTGDSLGRVTAINNRYEYPLLVGHRIYASKEFQNSYTMLPNPQLVVLDAGSLAVKDSVVLTGVQQILSMQVIGKSGALY